MRKFTLKKAAGILTTVVTVLVVLLAAAILYTKARSKIFFFGRTSYIFVMTESMEPEIPARSYVKVEKISAEDVCYQDVIVFYSDDPSIEGSLNTHRVIGISPDGKEFTTKGDNNVAADRYPVRAEAVAARYVGPAPRLSAISNFFLSKAGLIVTLSVIFVLCMGMYLPDIIRAASHAANRESDEEHDALLRARIEEEVKRLEEQNAKGALPLSENDDPPKT